MNFLFNWANNLKRKTMKGRVCKVLARGKMNSILIEFCDTKQREIVSRNSLKKTVERICLECGDDITMLFDEHHPEIKECQCCIFDTEIVEIFRDSKE